MRNGQSYVSRATTVTFGRRSVRWMRFSFWHSSYYYGIGEVEAYY